MTLNVACDPSGTLYRTYMVASGNAGIPRIFVVDGQGKIAWIGHPDDLAKHLPEIVAGTHDYVVPISEELANEIRRRVFALSADHGARERSASRFNEEYVTGLLKEELYEEAYDALSIAAQTYLDLPSYRSAFRQRQLCIMGLTSRPPQEAFTLALEMCAEFANEKRHSAKTICHSLINYHSVAPEENRDDRVIELVFALLETDPPGSGTIDAIRDRAIRARALAAKDNPQQGVAEIEKAIDELEQLIVRLRKPATPEVELVSAQEYLNVLERQRAKMQDY